ncbi:MAG: hypothetical protein AABY96_08175 [Nitrospirota bacterium]
MPKLPALDLKTGANHSPHVVILGAGASRAATPTGDANGKLLPVMADFVKTLGLAQILNRANVDWIKRNFEDVYDDLYKRDPNAPEVNKIDRHIRSYFRSLVLPNCLTVYDSLLLSLREKDLVASFNWDPLLAQAYNRHAGIQRHLPRLVFLHGNVGFGFCLKCRRKGPLSILCENCKGKLTPPPLLYPVHDKNYTRNPFIAAEWEELEHTLSHAYFLTIFGYSAPKTDTAAIKMMQAAWSKNETQELAQIEIIDIRPEKELVSTWKPFILREHYGVATDLYQSYLAQYPRRSCEALAWATLQQTPWQYNRMPSFRSPSEIRSWIAPLVEEEAHLDQGGHFSREPCPTPS